MNLASGTLHLALAEVFALQGSLMSASRVLRTGTGTGTGVGAAVPVVPVVPVAISMYCTMLDVHPSHLLTHISVCVDASRRKRGEA